MTPGFFLNLDEQDFLSRDSGSIAALGSLWGVSDDGSIYKHPVKKKQSTFVEQVFRSGIPAHIDLHLTVTSVQQVQQYDCRWEGFVMKNILFLKGNGLNVLELKERSLHVIIEIMHKIHFFIMHLGFGITVIACGCKQRLYHFLRACDNEAIKVISMKL
ncbi:1255_t:CDS:2 [Cetraspora pellucida]|uniref:1255_t:CDS:1 n=1 Tax=Cetraspora pellucida TaxID=1433469 RepID=A0A9N9N480_9GLOM|nr:1255_t:CDS:2 [Cetraspora pellucida]